MLKERRKYRRLPVTEQLSVRFNDEFLRGTECSDISIGGMCIVFDDVIKNNNKYGTVMLVQKYDEETIFFQSKFVRLWDNLVYVDRKDTRMGVKFIELDSENFESLNKIIDMQTEKNVKVSGR